MIQFSRTVEGVEVLNRGFNRIQQYISDFRSVWPEVAKTFYAIEEQQFKSEGAHGASGRWAALSPAYAKFKAVAFPGQPILRATAGLYESMTSPDALDSIFRMDAREMTVGTQHEAARAHQKGSSKRKLPARPIISLTQSDKRRMQKAIQAGLVQFTRNLGFQVDEKAA